MPVIQSQVSTASDTFRANTERMRALVNDISTRAATVERGGSEESRQRHVSRGKLLPRDRLAQLRNVAPRSRSSVCPLRGRCATRGTSSSRWRRP